MTSLPFDPSPFLRTGTCNGCDGKAYCCQNMTLGFNGRDISSQSQYNQLIRHDSRNKVWEKVRINPTGTWVFSCQNLDVDGSCSNYENRPTNCRLFPSASDFIPSTCSYSFSINPNIEASLTESDIKQLLTQTPQFPLIQKLHVLLRERNLSKEQASTGSTKELCLPSP